MANFFQKLFQNKQSKKVLPTDNIRQGEARVQTVNVSNNMNDNVLDEKILDIFSYNRYLLHRVFLPLFRFSLEIKIKPSIIADITIDAFGKARNRIPTLSDFEGTINRRSNATRSELMNNLNCLFDYDVSKELTENMMAEKLQHKFLYLGDHTPAQREAFNSSIIKLINRNSNTDYFFECFVRSEIETAFIKIFAFEKELSNIHENEELLKILTNAAFKYQNLDIIAERTYELFLDYYELQKHQFSFDSYTELMRVFFATKQSCNEFYKSEEMVFDFDVSLLSLEEIASKIISEKLYKKYDVDKLMVSLLYEKADDFTTLLDFIKELNSIDNKCERIKKAATKDDLLNGEYTSRKTSIVDVDLMTGVEFEEFLCNYFNTHGYVCTQTKASGDQGIDLVAKKDDYVLAIQAKCYTGTVGNHAIMEAVAGTKYYNANQTMVITNSTFTKSAVELAAVNNVILWDRQVLIEKLANGYGRTM